MTNDVSSVQPETHADLEQVPAYILGKVVPGALKIASSEMAQPPLPPVVEAISQTIADPTTSPDRYPGMDAVNLCIKFDEHLSPPMEQVAVGCGSSALCLQLVQAICTDRDEVALPQYSFEAYPILARAAGVTPVPVPLGVQGRNDLLAMTAAITDRTRLVFICSPNNPTGTTTTHEVLAEFIAQVPDDAVVILDEAYIELVDEVTHAATPLAHGLLDTYPNLVGLHAFSKVYGLARFRVGYVFGLKRLVEAVDKVATSFLVNTLVQIAAPASLDAQEELSARITKVRAQCVAVIRAINAAIGRETVLPNSQANFVWIDEGRIADLSLLGDVPMATVADSGDFLVQCNTLIRCFAGEGARITITTKEETSQLLAALEVER